MSARPAAAAPGELVEFGRFDIPGVASQRRVRVYLPSRRPVRATPRPLLVLFDGQNAFDDAGSFAGGWHAHLAVDRYAARRANPPVVVALDHGHAARVNELSPFVHGDALARWVAGELVPRARAAFGLSTEPAATVIGGSSMGALAALYAHYRHPEVFGGALAMSPSLWVARERTFAFFASQPLPWTSKVYLDVGGRESKATMVAAATRLAHLLAARGYTDARLRFRVEGQGRHHERAWRRRLPAALRFLFG